MKSTFSKIWSSRIHKLYSYATIIYILPFLFLLIYVLDNFTFEITQMFFFALFLASMLPCSVAGLILSIIGFRKSYRQNDTMNKDIGIAELFAGIFIFIGGLIGFAILYILTN